MEGNPLLQNSSARYSVLATAALGAGALAYIGLADPHRPGFLFPPCPFKAITGWNCPGCGGIRMTHDLLHADVGSALVDNAFALIVLPLLAVWIVIRRRQGRKVFPLTMIIALTLGVIAWTVVRNLPGFPLVPTFFAG